MIHDDYICDGQIEMVDYLDQLAAASKKCEGCIYFKDYKCVRSKCHKVDAAEGWHPLWYNSKGHVFGKWPTYDSWMPVITLCEGKEKIYECKAQAKDKGFKWPADTRIKFDDQVIGWKPDFIGV